ncbi:DegT/DnrJ/EryC1/StrS family aminotransferase [Ruminococcaceae bacterium OttesenSCG-928-L11]|nr:DegT/DnrJ/EryC1/StrS family aminotransferase [Ruminococcaceae bacterium OttesenSCG-928-L11]
MEWQAARRKDSIPVRDPFILNGEVDKLERQAADYMGVADCVLVDRASDGITLALKAAGVGRGDAVLCTPLGNSALIGAVRRTGGEPMFVDINPNSFTIDPYCLEYVVNKCRREKKPTPKALLATDLFGMPCHYVMLDQICSRYGIHLIADMQGSLGASVCGEKSGRFGRFAVASFFEEDSLGGLGSDGAIFCRQREDAAFLRQLRGGAEQQTFEKEPFAVDKDAQGVLIGKKLGQFDSDAAKRRKIAGWYRDGLSEYVRVQEEREGFRSACTRFAILLPDNDSRDRVMEKLTEEHIPCTVFCPVPLHKRKEFDWGRVILVNAEQVSRKMLLLPMHPYLSKNVVDYICRCVIDAVREPAPQTDQAMAVAL